MTFSDSETDSDLGIVPLARKQVNAEARADQKKAQDDNQKEVQVKKKRKKRMSEVEILNYRKWE